MAALTDEDVQAKLSDVDGWAKSGDAIEKVFEFEDFSGSVDFVNQLTPVANAMNHHPDLAISWNKVTVTLSTHSEGGLTDADFELAGKIDGLA
ncbi:MAG TPA: 4a-hydroxytetrahydrobiopterin dehydratase [Thermoleophilaceae bacterium]|jgi:4a-hydroxytetrahydrobiopterin dehydratase